MTDRRLSAAELEAFVCEHLCCRTPDDPNHQHLFSPSVCPICHRLEATQEGRSPWKS